MLIEVDPKPSAFHQEKEIRSVIVRMSDKNLHKFFQNYHWLFRSPLFTKVCEHMARRDKKMLDIHALPQSSASRSSPISIYTFTLYYQIIRLWWRSVELNTTCIDPCLFQQLMENNMKTAIEGIVLSNSRRNCQQILTSIPRLPFTLRHLEIKEEMDQAVLENILSTFTNLESLVFSFCCYEQQHSLASLVKLTQLECLEIPSFYVTEELVNVISRCREHLKTVRVVKAISIDKSLVRRLRQIPTLDIQMKNMSNLKDAFIHDGNLLRVIHKCLERPNAFAWKCAVVVIAAVRVADPELATSILNFFPNRNIKGSLPTEFCHMLMTSTQS